MAVEAVGVQVSSRALISLYMLATHLLIMVILFSLLGLGIGFLLVIKPNLAIEIQRRFYAKINWKIEPISMSKEVRNTRIMGLFLIVVLVITLVFLFTKNQAFP